MPMEPDFSQLNPDHPGGQEMLRHWLKRRQFLALGTGSMAGALALAALQSQAEGASPPQAPGSLAQAPNP
ncbi:MAG: hypothetical protein HC929_13725, partial [Leptolyngbyaceae cyanobacterium SM2_5_2]|nr:hypothetical protein [Leptolyngbyaceae cyanobacterium SM2_5_2]